MGGVHKAYVDREVSEVERAYIIAKFRNECIILSKLSHPNIVNSLVYIHIGRAGKHDLTESLDYDLDGFLISAPHFNTPLSLKLSILLNVLWGLVYLHELSIVI